MQLSSRAGIGKILDELRSRGAESLEAILEGAIPDGDGPGAFPRPVAKQPGTILLSSCERSFQWKENSNGIGRSREEHERPKDPNQLAKLVVDIATGEVDDPLKPKESG